MQKDFIIKKQDAVQIIIEMSKKKRHSDCIWIIQGDNCSIDSFSSWSGFAGQSRWRRPGPVSQSSSISPVSQSSSIFSSHSHIGVNIAETRRQSEKSWAESNFRANVCLKYFNQTGQEMFQKISFAVWSLKSKICARCDCIFSLFFQFVGVSGSLTRPMAGAGWCMPRSARSLASAAPMTSRMTSSTASSGIGATRSFTVTFPGVSQTGGIIMS